MCNEIINVQIDLWGSDNIALTVEWETEDWSFLSFTLLEIFYMMQKK